MSAEAISQKLDTQLAALATGEPRLKLAAQALTQLFKLRADEVAIFSLDPKLEMVGFLWPPKLKVTGNLPLSSNTALVARTIRDGKAFVNNSFGSLSHATIFETVKIDKDQPEAPQRIQKIMSIPLIRDGEKVGAIQLSRKGADGPSAGPDFGKNELALLADLAKVIARYV